MLNKKNFHSISYLQYPFTLSTPIVILYPLILDFDSVIKNPEVLLGLINSMFVLMGIGIGFSTLQDTSKVQNEVSRKVWSDKKKANFFIGVFSFTTVMMLGAGLFGFFFFDNSNFSELSLGLIVFGISMLGLLKAALEMAENHQKVELN